jgi:Fe-S cluster biogenesis protein NfuA
VLYPGLPTHISHDVAARQMTGGFGGMLSIRLAGGESAAMAVLAAVKVFKRGTSLGGVESLIEHRRSTEGASSPIPPDLLRLSIGLESLDDLTADLAAALETVPQAETVTVAPVAVPPVTQEGDEGIHDAVAAVIDRTVATALIARGGSVRIASVEGGIVTLEASGSPGAIMPAVARLTTLLRTTVPEIVDVRICWPGGTTQMPEAADVGAQVQRVLDEEVNRAVAAHGGHVTLVDVANGRVELRMEGGCQGCSLAEVTLRQGIEPILRKHVPSVAAVVDVTDHSAATAPFFAPGKR